MRTKTDKNRRRDSGHNLDVGRDLVGDERGLHVLSITVTTRPSCGGPTLVNGDVMLAPRPKVSPPTFLPHDRTNANNTAFTIRVRQAGLIGVRGTMKPLQISVIGDGP
jgi:hypothetical protein